MTDIDNELEPARGDAVTIDRNAERWRASACARLWLLVETQSRLQLAMAWGRELARERDEAQAELDRLRAEAKAALDCWSCEQVHEILWSAESRGDVVVLARKMRAEIERLTRERDRAIRDRGKAQTQRNELMTDIEAMWRVVNEALGSERGDHPDAESAMRHAIGQLTRERDEARARLPDATGESRDLRAQLEDARAEIERINAERVRLTEVVGYYARSNAPRLLGCAPDQIEAVRAVLQAFVDGWWRADLEVPAKRAELRARIANAVDAWERAGRPLAEPVFVCQGCQRAVPWSQGADDDGPELCDDCWAKRGTP